MHTHGDRGYEGNTNKAGAIRSLFSMRFAELKEAKEKAIKIESLLNKQNEIKVLSFTEKRANEVNFMDVVPNIDNLIDLV